MVFCIIAMCILGIFTFYFGFHYFSMKKELKMISTELTDISQELGENRILKQGTASKELEELLFSINEALKAIRKEKVEMKRNRKEFQEQIARISHDLRTPLTSLMGYLKLVNLENLSQQEQQDFAVIQRKAYVLERLITQFYEYSLVNNDGFVPELIRLDGARCLREVLLDSYRELEEKGFELDVTVPDSPVWIWADGKALERIYMNLLQNIKRYAKKNIRIMLTEQEQDVAISFENDMCEGISAKENPEKLFQSFYVGDTARTREGSGLGLTIARELAEKMEGKLEAKLKEDNRIAFLLTLKKS